MENRAVCSCDAGAHNDGMLPQELLRMAREGDIGLATEIFAIFQTDTASRLEILSRAVASADTGAITRQAHALKGSAGQVGAQALAEGCRRMETAAREGKMAEVSARLDRLQQLFFPICQAMSHLDLGDLSHGG